MVSECREGVDEVSVEESEDEEVRGDCWLSQLQVTELRKTGHCCHQTRHLPGIPGSRLSTIYTEFYDIQAQSLFLAHSNTMSTNHVCSKW